MQSMIDVLHEEIPEREADVMARFYKSIAERVEGIDNAEGKQKVIVELYDKFFKSAFPKVVEKLGIVYTPVEVVDFIIHSVSDVLQKEFGRRLTDENVHILDPFTGTGTFITRLLQSGLIEAKDLERKYLYELHANEIVLLAYYIASINIENSQPRLSISFTISSVSSRSLSFLERSFPFSFNSSILARTASFPCNAYFLYLPCLRHK